ncbi:DinB family protein [Cohnella endophytica]|uniref:DinB family protein n=1 Tax=Cohnella endophytica TaxID=2419778 RepID=A0A494YBI8_9BACL|nr:DinB family protein [Cohnella endophytica]RKP58016.1 DinB family protein [Cohnella endophytica]
MSNRPTQEEYNPHFDTYVRLVEDVNIQEFLAQALQSTTELLSGVTEEQGNYRYAPGKWSLKEVLGHITDNERIMGYRLLRIARGDRTPLSGYDQDELMSGASFDACSFADLLEDYAAVRRSTLTLLKGLSDEAWTRSGIVNDNPSTVRAWAYIIAGHEIHHLNIVRDKYLK